MKLTKLIILALGLMALTAASGFSYSAWDVYPAKRNVATSAETGEVNNIELNAATGVLGDPASIPADRSIFFTFSQPISALSDITVYMTFFGADAWLVGPISTYGDWYPIVMAYDGQIAEVRVGYNGADPNPQVVQIHFLENLDIYQGNTINLGGVRVNMDGLGGVEGQEVYVSLSNPEGDIAMYPSEMLPVAVLHHPIECIGCDDTISFRDDGHPGDDTTTITIKELFTNAFEAPEQIKIDISTIPTGFDFIGCTGFSATDYDDGSTGKIEDVNAVDVDCYMNPDYIIIQINDSNESDFEAIMVTLQFDLTGTPDPEFGQDPEADRATLTIYKYTEGVGLYPWYGVGRTAGNDEYLKYKKMPVICYADFEVTSSFEGKLLSVFNVSDETWETGLAIMNGSGMVPLDPQYEYQHWWDVPINGAVKVYMYPMYTYDAEDPFGYGPNFPPQAYIFTTSATIRPGLGLDEYGRLPANGTWALLTSQACGVAIYDANGNGVVDAGETTTCADNWPTFEGAIIFETYFPDAEGVNFIADWGGANTMSHGYPMINLFRRELYENKILYLLWND